MPVVDSIRPSGETSIMCVGTCHCFTATLGLIGAVWSALLVNRFHNKPAEGFCDQPVSDWLLFSSVLWFVLAALIVCCFCVTAVTGLIFANQPNGSTEEADALMRVMMPSLACMAMCLQLGYQFVMLIGLMYTVNASTDQLVCDQEMLQEVRRFLTFQIVVALANCCAFAVLAAGWIAYRMDEDRKRNDFDPERPPLPGERRDADKIPAAHRNGRGDPGASDSANESSSSTLSGLWPGSYGSDPPMDTRPGAQDRRQPPSVSV